MKIDLNVGQLNGQIKQMIERAEALGKDVTKCAETTVETITHKLEEETVIRMPVDEGFLEKSVDRKVEKGGSIHNTWGIVWIPTNSPASEYAMFMHEMFYKLGPRSKAKQAGNNDVLVGRKYMERAMDENARAFGLYIIKKFKELIGD